MIKLVELWGTDFPDIINIIETSKMIEETKEYENYMSNIKTLEIYVKIRTGYRIVADIIMHARHRARDSLFTSVLLERKLKELGIICSIVEGYCVIAESKIYGRHYWVETNNIRLNVSHYVLFALEPELAGFKIRYPIFLSGIPKGYKNKYNKDPNYEKKAEYMFELHEENYDLFFENFKHELDVAGLSWVPI